MVVCFQIQAAPEEEEAGGDAMDVDKVEETEEGAPDEDEALPEDMENLIRTETSPAEHKPRVLTDDEMRGMVGLAESQGSSCKAYG